MKTLISVFAVLILAACQGQLTTPGPSDPDLIVISTQTCEATTLDWRGDPRQLVYERMEFNTGLLALTCTGHDHQLAFSRTRFVQPGGVELCRVQYDLDSNNSTGMWNFSGDEATYEDAGSPFDGRLVMLTCN